MLIPPQVFTRILAFTCFLILPVLGQDYGIEVREPVASFFDGALPARQPGPTGSWTTVDAFPNLTFIDPDDETFTFEPVFLTGAPRSSKLYVCDKKGKIRFFENDPEVSEWRLFLDISDRVKITPNAGMGEIAFHPDFGLPGSPNRGYVYLHYFWSPDETQLGPKNQAPDSQDELPLSGFWRLSRFTVPDGSARVDPASESILIQQYDPHHWHNGGSMFFDKEGFLYLSSGDIGADKNYYKAGQMLTEGLFGTVLRIDVDQDESRSHPIRRQPTDHDFARKTRPKAWAEKSFSQGYYIPNDNPWLDEDGALLEEFWCIGIRSPHRMSYDEKTGQIWVGDVGQFRKEEVNLIVKGGNYQWPYKDGTLTGYDKKPGNLIGEDQPPVYEYTHTSNGAAVVGGYVYRGFEHRTDLEGKYLFAEHQGGQVWVMTPSSEDGKPKVEKLTTIKGCGFHNGPSSFGKDNDGELYICLLKRNSREQAITGGIVKLARTEATTNPEAPELLSQTGVFSDLPARTPVSKLVPYDPGAPFWSDSAIKTRYLAIPAEKEQIVFSGDDNWSFPQGSVFVKHFDYPVDDGDPTKVRPVETRFLIHGSDGNYFGFTYRWNDEGTDATLVQSAEAREIEVASTDGTLRKEKWYYPSRAECMHCHTAGAGYVLGVRTHQLNGVFEYTTGVTDNQLRTLNHLGLFTESLDELEFANYLSSKPITDLSVPLEDRVRSYLDSNCSQCHRPGGVYAGFDARLTTDLEDQGIINGGLIRDYGIEGQGLVRPGNLNASVLYQRIHSVTGEKMPPLAKNKIDEEALRVMSEWVHSLDPGSDPPDELPPAAISDLSKVWSGGEMSIDILANDFDRNNDLDPATVEIVTPASQGTAVFDSESRMIQYSHTGEGNDFFTYRVSDQNAASSNVARVEIEIRPREEFPPDPEPEPEPEPIVEPEPEIVSTPLPDPVPELDPEADFPEVVEEDVAPTPSGFNPMQFGVVGLVLGGVFVSALLVIIIGVIVEIRKKDS